VATVARLRNDEQEFLNDSPIDPELADDITSGDDRRAGEAGTRMRRRLTGKALKRDPRRPGAWFGWRRFIENREVLKRAYRPVGATLKVCREATKRTI